MAKKQKVTVHVKSLEVEDFDGDIDYVIQHLNELKSEFPDYDNLYISASQFYDEVSFSLMGQRDETDDEVRERLSQARKNRARLKAREQMKQDAEYQEFLRLKEKFKD